MIHGDSYVGHTRTWKGVARRRAGRSGQFAEGGGGLGGGGVHHGVPYWGRWMRSRFLLTTTRARLLATSRAAGHAHAP